MPSSVTAQYAEAVAAGRIEEDQAQLSVVSLMAQLEARLVEHRLARKSSALGWLFASRAREQPAIKGLYIYGAVGRGKTMLMDFFFEATYTPSLIWEKLELMPLLERFSSLSLSERPSMVT